MNHTANHTARLLVPLLLAGAASGMQTDALVVDVSGDVGIVAGVPASATYGLTLTVEVLDASAVSVTPPNGPSQALTNTAGDVWQIHWTGTSIADLDNNGPGFGSFLLQLTDTNATVDTVSVVYDDPSAVAAMYPGYAEATSPMHADTDVMLDATLNWACISVCGDAGWSLRLDPLSPGVAYETELSDPAAVQWTPGCLTPSTTYQFCVSSASTVAPPQTLMTAAGDSFVYSRGWESSNEVKFTTQVAPAFASATLRNGGANPATHTATPPVLGTDWSATAGSPAGHNFARLFAFLDPAMIPLNGGQVLLGTSRLAKLPPMPGPTASWSFTLPYDCSLAGFPLTTQVVLFGGVTPFALTNAQDLVIGF